MNPTPGLSARLPANCLCGAVRFTAKPRSKNVGVCHCEMCRTWGGGPFIAVECDADIAFEGEDNISIFDSSNWAQRGFCKTCGSHLFYRLKEDGHYAIPVGLFSEQTDWILAEQIFIEQKPAFYNFAEKTKNLTGTEALAGT